MISRATLALMAAAAPLATEAMRPAPGSALGLVQDTMRHLTTFKMETGGEEMDDDEMDDDEMEDMPMEDMPMEDSDGGVANASTEAATPVPAEEVPAEECSTIAQLAETTPDLSTLFTAVSAAPSVAADLSTLTEEFTVFAPNNDAFALIPPEPLAALLNLTDVLTFLLEVHVVPGAVYAEELMDGDVLETVNGGNLTVAINDGTVYITAPGEGGTMGTVLLPDVEACNGVVHIIDSVLLPGAPPSEGADPAPAMTPMSDPVTPVVEPIVTTTPPMPEPAPMPAVTPVVRVAEPVTDPAPVPAPEPEPEPEVVEAVPPVTPPPPPPPTKTADGEFVFALCIQGESQNFGPIEGEDGVKRGEGVTITSAGTCSWQEFAGGFDGYPSRGIDDGHEKGMDEAIKEMFPGDFDKQTAFLQSMVDIADPVNLDYPQDKAIADGGKRMENIGKLNAACSSLITIQC